MALKQEADDYEDSASMQSSRIVSPKPDFHLKNKKVSNALLSQ